MAGTSALLRSAEARRSKILQQEDALVAYEYSQSTKTYDDFLSYSNYLNERSSKTSDISKRLSYQKNIDSAQSGYFSNEIQRQSINVVEGRGSNTDKYSKMVSLYNQALNNGNYDIAQSLNLQLDNLSVSIQNEQEAGQKAASTMALNSVKSLKKLVEKFKNGDELIQLPDGTVIKPLSMLGAETKQNGTTSSESLGYFGEALRTVLALKDTVESAYVAASTQDAVDEIDSKFRGILDNTTEFKTAAGNLTLGEIDTAYRSAIANNPLYSPVSSYDSQTGQQVFKLKKNQVDDFVWTRNDDGSYNATQVVNKIVNSQQKLSAKITDEGYFLGSSPNSGKSTVNNGKTEINSDAGVSVNDRLKTLGYETDSEENGVFNLITPQGTYEATVQPNGSIRYFGDPNQSSQGQAGLYEISIFDGSVRDVAPDETSIFGTPSLFGGQLSRASEEGRNIIKSLSGVYKPASELFGRGATITNINNDFTGRSIPAVGSNLQGTSSLLSQAGQQRAQTLKAAETLQPLAQTNIQSSSLSNLNKTPVQQFASNGRPLTLLEVAKPLTPRNLSVAAPIPTAPIANSGVATNVSRISGVGDFPVQSKLTVR